MTAPHARHWHILRDFIEVEQPALSLPFIGRPEVTVFRPPAMQTTIRIPSTHIKTNAPPDPVYPRPPVHATDRRGVRWLGEVSIVAVRERQVGPLTVETTDLMTTLRAHLDADQLQDLLAETRFQGIELTPVAPDLRP